MNILDEEFSVRTLVLLPVSSSRERYAKCIGKDNGAFMFVRRREDIKGFRELVHERQTTRNPQILVEKLRRGLCIGRKSRNT
jgi:hypothetical protein